MATNAEKAALGLAPEATDEDVKKAITSLKQAADAGGGGDREKDSRIAELEASLREAEEASANQSDDDEEVAELKSKLAEAIARLDRSATATSAGLKGPSKVDGDEETHEVTIKIRAFPYYVDEEDLVSGTVVRREKIAQRGEVVALGRVDYARATKFDAYYTGEEGPGPSTEQQTATQLETGQVSFRDATVADISAWISETEPSASRVVEEANNDPELAKKLLEAESHATGGEPREDVVEELQEIIEG